MRFGFWFNNRHEMVYDRFWLNWKQERYRGVLDKTNKLRKDSSYDHGRYSENISARRGFADGPAAGGRLVCPADLGFGQRVWRVHSQRERTQAVSQCRAAGHQSDASPRKRVMNLSRRTFLKASGSGAALLATVGCNQLPRELRFLYGQAKANGPFQPLATAEIDPVTHVLNRVAFGPRPGDYERARKLGPTPEQAAAAYLEQQLNPERIDDEEAEYAARRFET